MDKPINITGNDHTTVVVSVLPECNVCQSDHAVPIKTAAYDAATIFGPWAYLCEDHFAAYGLGLGLGRGQKLIMVGPDHVEAEPRTDAEIARDLQAAVEAGDFDLAEEILGDRDIAEFM